MISKLRRSLLGLSAAALALPAFGSAAALGPNPSLCAQGNDPSILVHVSGLKDRAGKIRVRTFAGPESFVGRMDRIRVAHLTDLHVGRVTPMDIQRGAIAAVAVPEKEGGRLSLAKQAHRDGLPGARRGASLQARPDGLRQGRRFCPRRGRGEHRQHGDEQNAGRGSQDGVHGARG